MGFLNRLTHSGSAFSCSDPVDCGQQLHAKGCLKTFHKVYNPVEPSAGVRMAVEKDCSLLDRRGEQFDLFVGGIFSVSVALDEMALDMGEHVAQIGRVRAVWTFGIL